MFSPHIPRRVVSLQPSATVILDAIGRLDCLVACTKYCADVCPEVSRRGIAIVSDSWTANAEQISKTAPDLVIAAVPYQEKAVAEILKSGTRFLGLAPRSLSDIYTDIVSIAGMFAASACAEQIIAKMRDEISVVREQTRGKARPRVFCEEWGKPIITSQSWVAELVEAVGAGLFRIYAVSTIDQGIEILTGYPAGERGGDGSYMQGTINSLVEKRLKEYSEGLRKFATEEAPPKLQDSKASN